ncbi:LemA family protein [Microbulbifer sp. 2201CG32-9]|uniref:LemA family protein n=1 Tax=Microbulbifer sp. 2201CG32-9 TaxID=3232309 RepID=UPI00345C1588
MENSSAIWIWAIAAAALIFYVVGVYNKLIALKNRCQNAFAQIEVQLKRRYDLIPNLVDTAKVYLKRERETLEAVTSARNLALTGLQAAAANPGSASAIADLGQAEGALATALGRLQVVMEAYPELKADQNMLQLTEELTSTENKVAFARQAFNDSVMAYNIYKQSFPPVFVAGFFGHRQDGKLLEFADSEQFQAAPR